MPFTSTGHDDYGPFGLNVSAGSPGLFYPGTAGLSYINGSGLWFGTRRYGIMLDTLGQDPIPINVSFVAYDPNNGGSWGMPGTWPRPATSADIGVNRLAYSPDYDRTDGAYAGTGVARPAWPLWTKGEEPVTMAHPGSYRPDSLSRTMPDSGSPAFVAGVAEQFFSRYHDGYSVVTSGGEYADAIGLQIEQNTYSCSGGSLDNIVILHYRVINVSGDTLPECHAAMLVDPDIMLSSNDRVAFYAARPELATGVMWSGPESGPRAAGTLLITMLESPSIDARGFIRHDRRDYDTSQQVGVGAFRNLGIGESPRSQSERYLLMASSRIDGDDGPGDQQVLLGTAPFNMAPGDTARFAIAYTILGDLVDYNGSSSAAIEIAADRVITLYRSGSTGSIPVLRAAAGGPSIGRIHPNPATSRVVIDLHLERSAGTSIRLTDQLGRIVLERVARTMEAGVHTVALDVAGVAPGLYIVTVESAGAVRSGKMVVTR